MEGYGRGRWRRTGTKLCVEDYPQLEVHRLARVGALEPGASGILRWVAPATGHELGSMRYQMVAAEQTLRLTYLSGASFSWDVRLLETRPGFGGARRWFACPAVAAGMPCGRRVGTLYLRHSVYGCRRCQDLRYRSSQEAHRTERILRRTLLRKGRDPKEARRMAEEFNEQVRLVARVRNAVSRVRDRHAAGR